MLCGREPLLPRASLGRRKQRQAVGSGRLSQRLSRTCGRRPCWRLPLSWWQLMCHGRVLEERRVEGLSAAGTWCEGNRRNSDPSNGPGLRTGKKPSRFVTVRNDPPPRTRRNRGGRRRGRPQWIRNLEGSPPVAHHAYDYTSGFGITDSTAEAPLGRPHPTQRAR